MRRVSSRLALFAVLAVSALGFAAVGATAKTSPPPTKPKVVIKGGTTTITATTAAVKLLTSHKIGVVAVAPAKLSGTSLSLPVKGGFALPKSLNGVLLHTGKLQYTHGKKTVTLSRIALYKAGSKAHLAALVGGKLVNLGSLTGFKVTVKGKTATVTGEFRLSGAGAALINTLAGKHVVKAGYDFGNLTSSLTTK